MHRRFLNVYPRLLRRVWVLAVGSGVAVFVWGLVWTLLNRFVLHLAAERSDRILTLVGLGLALLALTFMVIHFLIVWVVNLANAVRVLGKVLRGLHAGWRVPLVGKALVAVMGGLVPIAILGAGIYAGVGYLITLF